MDESSIDGTQLRYARLAGFMYLVNYATAIVGTLIPLRIRGPGDFAERAERIVASEHLYRIALTTFTISWVIIVILAFSLYVALEPVNKRLAQLALLFEIGQAVVGGVTVIFSYAVLQLYTVTPRSGAFQDDQLQGLTAVLWSAAGSGFHISMTFLSLGSTIFFYLFYKSRYVPRPLAAWGMIASVVLLIVSLGALTFPEYARTLQYGWGVMGIAEVTTGFWLMIRGIRLQKAKQRMSGYHQ
ncbi:MAG: DUF4386 domain-containing protein [Gemmatimonadaceae bacterium]